MVWRSRKMKGLLTYASSYVNSEKTFPKLELAKADLCQNQRILKVLSLA